MGLTIPLTDKRRNLEAVAISKFAPDDLEPDDTGDAEIYFNGFQSPQTLTEEDKEHEA